MPPGAGAAGDAAAAFQVSNPLGWATLGAGVLSGLFGGQQEQDNLNKQIALQSQLGNLGLDTEGVGSANQLFRQAQTQPIRDQIMFALKNRLMQSPGQFKPNDFFNGGTAGGQGQPGGIDLNTLQSQMGGYKPGMGGAGTPDMYKQMLGRLGYGMTPVPTPTGNAAADNAALIKWRQQNDINRNAVDAPGGIQDPGFWQKAQQMMATQQGFRN